MGQFSVEIRPLPGSVLGGNQQAGFSTSATGAAAPGSTGWSYSATDVTLDFLAAGETISWSYTVTATDSAGATATATVSFTITGTNDAPTIDGVATGSSLEANSGTTVVTGTLTVTDVDAGEAAFTAQTDSSGSYGTFSITSDGVWTYTLTEDLYGGQVVEEVFTVTTIDGTTRQVTVTVTGTVAPVPLAELAQDSDTRGFQITGASGVQGYGASVSGAGDVNGDGFDDLIIGSTKRVQGEAEGSYTTVVFGKAGGAAVDMSDGSAGLVIVGARGRSLDTTVSGAGDVNGDGLDDLIVGASASGSYAGASYVVFGKASGTVDLTNLGTGGFVINGATANDYSGFSVSAAGDVNGDGLADLIVGAHGADPGGRAEAGTSYVVFGKADGTAVALSAIAAGTGGFAINGAAASDESGRSVRNAGDVNGDGLDDLIVGAHKGDPGGAADAGTSYLIFGKTGGGAVELSNLGAGGFAINGVTANDWSGYSVSGAGDVNGDGLADLVVGAHGADPGGRGSAGTSYVIFGKTGGGTVELSTLGTGGFAIIGAAANDFAGYSVSAAGDVNGDGLGDLIVGAYGADAGGANSGASYLVFGKTGDVAVELSAIAAGVGGFVIRGASAGDAAGKSVRAAGDVDGDGFDDLIVGAPGVGPDSDESPSAGAAYVIFGGNFTGSVGEVGTSGADTMTGTDAADSFTGGDGADMLTGGGGADVLSGGRGNDVIAVADLAFRRVDGGSGTDTLRIAGNGQILDLAAATGDPALAPLAIESIERIDLAGGGNTLRLSALDIQRLSDGSANGAATLRVTGGVSAGGGTDAVILTGGGWTTVGQQTYDGTTFDVFQSGRARIEIATEVDRSGGPMPPVNLAQVAAGTDARGFAMYGVRTLDEAGFSVSAAGDVNGDGWADVIVGARLADPINGRSNNGASYVVFGKAGGAAVQLSSLGTGGFTIQGAVNDDQAGWSVSGAGDVNGDGLDDLIVGAPYANPGGRADAGTSYVVFGKTGSGAVDLANLGSAGFAISGVTINDYAGLSVSSAGDVNGDGLADLIVGAHGAEVGATGDAGKSYVVFGKADGTAVQLSSLGTGGFVINGAAASDNAGRSVHSAGDVNGDGLDDLFVGAPYADPDSKSSAGMGYVVFGQTGSTAVDLTNLGTGGFAIIGAAANDFAGYSVSDAGDVNGDGLADLIIGAYGADPGGRGSAGTSYVVFGKIGTAKVDLSNLGTGGFAINGVTANDWSGYSVSGAGDVNGDGLDDLIIGAHYADPAGQNAAGASYVVYGKADGSAVALSAIASGTGGFVIQGGLADDRSGFSVSAAGDVDGDGFADLIVGAPLADPGGRDKAGAAYVVFGGNFTGAVSRVGTAGNDSLTGTAAAEGFVGGDGNDTLTGGGGADVLAGGRGDDLLIVGDTGFARVDGGAGTDTLRLGGTDLTLDFTATGDLPIRSIERIDLNGGGNTLKLSALDIQRLSDDRHLETGETANGSLTLRVLGGDGDRVELTGGGWTTAAQVNEGDATFNVYELGRARIEIATGLGVDGAPSAVGSLMAAQEAAEVELTGLLLAATSGADSFRVPDLAGTVTIAEFQPDQGDVIDLSAFDLADFDAVRAAVVDDGPDTRLSLDADTDLLIADFLSSMLDEAQFHLPTV